MITKLDYVTISEMARECNLNPSTIRAYIKQGAIDCFILPRGVFLIPKVNIEPFKKWYNSNKVRK